MPRTPLDLDALRKQHEKELLERSRPRFLSQDDRIEHLAALELQKRAQAIESRYILPNVQTGDKSDRPLDAASTPFRNLKRKRDRITDPRKFTFDWSTTDDTSDASLSFAPSISMNTKEDRLNKDKEINRSDIDEQHWSDKPLEKMSERDWRIFKEDYNIQIKGENVSQPLRSWSEAKFPRELETALRKHKYDSPSSIQRATIPIVLAGRDVIGIAETGSGKTASFVLPILKRLQGLPRLTEDNRNNGPYALILAPTRELVQQIEAETQKFARVLDFRAVSIVGGRAIEEQAFNLQEGAEIVIATPGRLLDCLDRHVLVLHQCAIVIMDEADRMVDLGFEDAVNAILDATRKQQHETHTSFRANQLSAKVQDLRSTQTIMFSATMPPAVESLARTYLNAPATVIIGNAGQAVETIEQRVEIVNGESSKCNRMATILNSGEFDKPVIIFVNTKKSCDVVARHLNTVGWHALVLHGSKTQEQRESSLQRLRSGAVDVLVATDLAGRGIDVPDISLVLNFDMAKNIEDYVHRIGRTGRAGKSGVAITFIQDEEHHLFYPLKTVLKNATHVPAQIRMATKTAPVEEI